MRNMSFALTTDQITHREKSVTRRHGWLNLKPGDRIRAVKKCMGLKKGEPVEELAIIQVVDVRREPLKRMVEDLDYGFKECALEGFAKHPVYQCPSEFVAMFCSTHKGCTPETDVTRIEFTYDSGPAGVK